MILQCVRWYVASSLSYRELEELMQERGYEVDHSTIQRWVVYYAPRIEKAFRKKLSLLIIVYCDFNKFATDPII
jgi:putative transposase